MSSKARLLVFATSVLILLAAGLSADQTLGFRIVVNGSQAGAAIRQDQLVAIYLGKVTRWGDGTLISPVDQSTRSPVRVSFARDGLAMPIGTFQSHWVHQVVAYGLQPPVVKESDAAVIAFVASKPGAIGYVSADAEIGDGVRILALLR